MAKISNKPVKKVVKSITPKTPIKIEITGEETETKPIIKETLSIIDIIMELVNKWCENNKMEGKQYSLTPEEIRNILRSVL
jgi:hypothetical protein